MNLATQISHKIFPFTDRLASYLTQLPRLLRMLFSFSGVLSLVSSILRSISSPTLAPFTCISSYLTFSAVTLKLSVPFSLPISYSDCSMHILSPSTKLKALWRQRKERKQNWVCINSCSSVDSQIFWSSLKQLWIFNNLKDCSVYYFKIDSADNHIIAICSWTGNLPVLKQVFWNAVLLINAKHDCFWLLKDFQPTEGNHEHAVVLP